MFGYNKIINLHNKLSMNMYLTTKFINADDLSEFFPLKAASIFPNTCQFKMALYGFPYLCSLFSLIFTKE